jgi:hypothetical protein
MLPISTVFAVSTGADVAEVREEFILDARPHIENGTPRSLAQVPPDSLISHFISQDCGKRGGQNDEEK